MNTTFNPSSLIVPLVFTAIFLWAMYRRLRRIIGRQPLSRARAQFLVMFYPLMLLVFAAISMSNTTTLLAMAVGAAVGLAGGFLGLRLTTFEATPEGLFYTPNVLVGMSVFVLLIGRIGYRYYMFTNFAAPGAAPPSYTSDPLTLATLAIMGGYFATYSFGLLRWEKRTMLAVGQEQPQQPEN
jgi:hypothetical protein